MDKTSILEENWSTLVSFFPKNWKYLARTSGAMTRQLRGFDSSEAMLRTLLLHIAHGYSLRETVVRAKAAGLGSISDVALLKRLRYSEEWFKELCCLLLQERQIELPKQKGHPLTIRLVDGTTIQEQGQSGSRWRLHYSLNLPHFQCDYFELTPAKGAGTGETLQKIPVSANDCLIADRGFSRAKDIHHVINQKGHLIVRVNTQSLPLYEDASTQRSFKLLEAVQEVKEAGETRAWEVFVREPEAKEPVSGRICIIRKSEQAIAKSLKKLRQKASKSQRELKEQTIEFAKYVIVFTTVPEEILSATDVLEWYRVRWQIELVFKRFKSLAKLGYLPKYDASSSRAWLYGKLFVCLLTEKIIRCSSAISPWGYEAISGKDKEYLA